MSETERIISFVFTVAIILLGIVCIVTGGEHD